LEFEKDLRPNEIGIVTSIEEWSLAFSGIENVIIPDSVSNIGVGAFYGLTEENITLGTGYQTYFAYSEDGKTLEGHIGMPNSDLDLTMLPAEVTSIGFNVFNGYELSTVTFSSNSNISTIDNYAFFNNDLTSIIIPNSVTSIGNFAFANNQIKNVTIPDSVISIGELVFENNKLESLNFEVNSSLMIIGKNAFRNTFDKIKNISIVIPDSVTKIGDYAFYNNHLNNVIIGNCVTSIGHSAFFENSLISIDIADNVETIGGNAFYNNNLSNITIGNSVTSIGGAAFHSNSLTSITIPDDVNIGNTAFASNALTTITIGKNVTLEANVLGSDEFKTAYESGGAGTYNGTQMGPWTLVYYNVSGRVIDGGNITQGVENVTLSFSDGFENEITDNTGAWSKSELQGEIIIEPQRTGFGQFATFSPSEYFVDASENDIIFYRDKEIFNNNNIGGVLNGPTNETKFTINNDYKITHIRTYHYNSGYGKVPGTIQLLNESNESLGIWGAEAWEDIDKYWYVEPNIELTPGTYTIIDSDNSTWSHNYELGHRGFAYVGGIFIDE